MRRRRSSSEVWGRDPLQSLPWRTPCSPLWGVARCRCFLVLMCIRKRLGVAVAPRPLPILQYPQLFLGNSLASCEATWHLSAHVHHPLHSRTHSCFCYLWTLVLCCALAGNRCIQEGCDDMAPLTPDAVAEQQSSSHITTNVPLIIQRVGAPSVFQCLCVCIAALSPQTGACAGKGGCVWRGQGH